ncbi:unnamed protein product [Arctogadus glacialis]
MAFPSRSETNGEEPDRKKQSDTQTDTRTYRLTNRGWLRIQIIDYQAVINWQLNEPSLLAADRDQEFSGVETNLYGRLRQLQSINQSRREQTGSWRGPMGKGGERGWSLRYTSSSSGLLGQLRKVGGETDSVKISSCMNL